MSMVHGDRVVRDVFPLSAQDVYADDPFSSSFIPCMAMISEVECEPIKNLLLCDQVSM